MFIRNMNISRRSALGFGLIGLIVLLLGVFALRQMTMIRDEAAKVSSQNGCRASPHWVSSINIRCASASTRCVC
ncbi:Methyl-accepting chemotaxis protein OS=Stutzerimonas stutzeri OX=316 GN=CXK95_16080 PE=3 SV=1 [Stutzerimonas stutzeri]